jgi:hypothetical protein
MPLGAKKCIHCNSYQDVRRFIEFGSSFTSALAATISVSTALFVFADRYRPEYTDPEILYLSAANRKLEIELYNRGKLPGYLEKLSIVGRGTPNSGDENFVIEYKVPDDSRSVNEGERLRLSLGPQDISYAPTAEIPTEFWSSGSSDCQAFLWFYSDVVGRSPVLRRNVPCVDVFGLMLAKQMHDRSG